jgi:dTMP kinase
VCSSDLRTYLIDIDPRIGVKRSVEKNNRRNKEVRFENMNIEFHDSVRKGFLNIANNDKRFLIIDGTKPQEAIAGEIYADIASILGIQGKEDKAPKPHSLENAKRG